MEDLVKKIKSYKKEQIIFTKKNYKDSVINDRDFNEEVLKEELLKLDNLEVIEPQTRKFKGKTETRYRVYLIYSNSKGKCFIIKPNKNLKIITVFPLGRKTLNKWKNKLKRGK